MQNTTNSSAFIEAQQYSQFILENLHDGLLPGGMFRNVSDFPAGSTLNIKSVGSVTIQEAAEDTDLGYSPIDSSTVTLSITDYVGDAWYVTDILRQDGSQIEQLMAQRAMESTRAIQEHFETRFLEAIVNGQTSAAVNLVNGRPHRWVAGGAGASTRNMTLDDFIAMKLSFDKANVPQAGRIALVDPIVEASLNQLVTTANATSYNPMWEGIITSGFEANHKFVRNIMGFDIWTSNRLPTKSATEALDASSYGLANDTAEIGDVANIFMSVLDDQTKPGMVAWRQMPNVEGERNKDKGRDEFVARARWGVGTQRIDTLGVIFTDEATY